MQSSNAQSAFDLVHLALEKTRPPAPIAPELTDVIFREQVSKLLQEEPQSIDEDSLFPQDEQTVKLFHQLLSPRLFLKGNICEKACFSRAYFRFKEDMPLYNKDILSLVLLVTRILEEIPGGFYLGERPLTKELYNVRIALGYFTTKLQEVESGLCVDIDALAKSLYPVLEHEDYLNPLFFERTHGALSIEEFHEETNQVS